MIGVLGYGRRVGAAHLRRALVVLASFAVTLLVFGAGGAYAETPKLVSYGNFFAEGPGVAVDQATGGVFTAGTFSYCASEGLEDPCGFGGKLQQFDSEGGLVKAFGPKAFYSSAAVNPVNKDLYVLSAFGAVQEYEPSTGELVSSFSVPTSPAIFGLTFVQIATDAAGNVYVPVSPENEVLEYSETGTLLNTFTGTGADRLKHPSGVAVDAAGNLWVADQGNNRIEELSPTDTPVSEIESEGVSSLALSAEGNLVAYVYNSATLCPLKRPPCSHIVEYSSTGKQIGDFGAGTIERRGSALEFPFGWNGQVAADPSTNRIYVSDISSGLIWMFSPPKAPEVSNELAIDLTSTGADLGALVNAGGLPTTYSFEYGTTTAYGNVAPAREGHAGGTKPLAVWASAGGLEPNTTYHFRVVARNSLGTAQGVDQTFTTSAAHGSCANESFRTDFSAGLPDCRAYEMVTQPNNASAEPDSTKGKGIEIKGGWAFPGGGFTSNHAARDGNRFAYWALEVMPGSESSGMEYLATRGASGWSYESVIPRGSYTNNFCTEIEFGNAIQAYSSQLTTGVLRVGANDSAGSGNIDGNSFGGCNAEGVEVVPGEPYGVENLLLRDNLTGSYKLTNTPPAGTIPTDAHFEGASSDLNHVLFKENTRLTENGPAGVEGLYEWDDGTLRLTSELPNGTAVTGSLAALWRSHPSVVSNDGSHVFFTAQGNLYARIDGERTVQLDEPQGGGGPGGGGEFQVASGDGTQAYFLDDASKGLTADTAAGSGVNLYRYAGGQLTDLTAAEHAEVTQVLGLSREGVYFVAKAALTGSQGNQFGETATEGKSNVYEWQGGTVTYIATLEGAGGTAVSPNGAFLAIPLTPSGAPYNNTDQKTGNRDTEIYLYDAASKNLACVSCQPSGEAPSAGGAGLAEIQPGSVSSEGAGQGAPHQVTDGGRVVFQTEEALLPTDTNGLTDVYEYEEGQVHLITSGTADSEAHLLDVSEEATDIFFLSRQPLVTQDLGGEGETNIIYDAREGGGFPLVASPPACTTAESCREPAAAQPSIYGEPSSQTFSGKGNLAPPATVHKRAKPKRKAKCGKGRVRKKGKCVKRKAKCGKGRVRKKGKCVKRKSAKKAKKSNHRGMN